MSANQRQKLSTYISRASTQTEFAELVGCSEPHLSAILSGNKHASIALARRICTHVNDLIPWKALLAPETAKALKDVA